MAEANSTAEGLLNQANASAQTVIDDANARAVHVIAEARQNAESMVSRFRDEASAIVGRAVGDLTALEARNAEALQAVAPAHPPEPAAAIESDEPDAAATSGEWENARIPESHDATWGSAPGLELNGVAAVEPDGQAPPHDEPIESAADEHLASSPQDVAEPPPAEVQPTNGAATSQAKTTSSGTSEPSGDTGPFQWLRSAIAGRDPSSRNEASNDERSTPSADGEPEGDLVVTRLVVHPAFTEEERRELQSRIGEFAGVQRASVGSVDGDSFDLYVTHEIFTSMLGSLTDRGGRAYSADRAAR